MSTAAQLSVPLPTGVSIGRSNEFNQDAEMMRTQAEVMGAIMVAQKVPRNEAEAEQSLYRACKRSSFADTAEYKFPRGKKKNEQTGKWEDNIVSGASVALAREAKRVWGNLQSGFVIIRDTPEERHIRAFAYDVQTNVKETADACFSKLIQRKVATGQKDERGWDIKETQWVEPDERDLRELTNRHASIAERNCVLQLIPSDIIEEAKRICRETLQQEATKDPQAARRRLISGFDDLNVTVPMIEAYIGQPISQASPKQIADLRAIWVSIRDGNSTWSELMVAKVDEITSYVTKEKAAEFYTISKASGYTDDDRKEYLSSTFSIDNGDSKKIPVEGFVEAMNWAKTKKASPVGEVVGKEQPKSKESPSISAEDAKLRKRIDQLFEIHSTKEALRISMLKDYEGRLQELVDILESELPKD